jgi:glycosyltransferase involved in cell wall biosynthesis
MNKRYDVIFYGPLGIAKSLIGGGESGNKKTIAVLKKNGFKIYVLEKPYLLNIPVIRSIIAPFQFFYKIFILIIKSNSFVSKVRIFHLSAFYCNLIFFEFLFIKIANLLNIKTIYEIRAGGMISAYKNRSIIYQQFFRATINSADSVLCQGIEYCSFLHESFNINSVYYPNYMEDKFVNKENIFVDRLKDETMHIVFVGRLSREKQIVLIIEIANKLKEFGLKFQVNLVGNGDLEYLSKVKYKCDLYNLNDSIIFHGKMQLTEINKLLQNQHFFVFPTKEKREGHSNSLTEAMNFGVVPIASNIGFNKTIINNPDLIINNFEAVSYATRMIEIFNNRNLWKKYSDEMHKRIKDNFTESIVSKTLLAVYSDLIQI